MTWDAHYMNKSTDLSTLYPLTKDMREALEDLELEQKVRRVARAVTGFIVLATIYLGYATYPEWSWIFTRS
jgi:chemotaxis regulatin CheY-phosphate phosphatase CheZ